MNHHRIFSGQDRRFALELKRTLRAIHEGDDARPRKTVYSAIGVHESTYCRWLDDSETELLPNLFDLRKLVNVTGDPAPLRVLAAWSGGGYSISPAEDDRDSFSTEEAHHLLSAHSRASSALCSGMAEDLADDGQIDRAEAIRRLPEAHHNLRVAQRTVDALQALAGGVQ